MGHFGFVKRGSMMVAFIDLFAAVCVLIVDFTIFSETNSSLQQITNLQPGAANAIEDISANLKILTAIIAVVGFVVIFLAAALFWGAAKRSRAMVNIWLYTHLILSGVAGIALFVFAFMPRLYIYATLPLAFISTRIYPCWIVRDFAIEIKTGTSPVNVLGLHSTERA